MILDRERLTNYPRIFLALYVTIGGWWVFSGPGLLDRSGTPVGADFVTFYAASVLGQRGEAVGAWDLARITEVERAVVGAEIPTYAFHYPPTFLLALLPLATLPYLGALAAWWAGTTAAFAAMARRIAPHPITLGLALAFPGFFQNIVQGQNGGFTAALLGGGLVLLDARPALGGALLGLLTYKPHLAPLVGVALLAGRRWRALAGFVGTAAVFAAASLAVFGIDPWRAFLANAPLAVRALETEGALPWTRMPTVQVAALLLGAPAALARGAQVVSTLAAVGAVAVAWGRGASAVTRAVTLACAALLATPFAFDYDLAVLAVPIAFLARDGARDGFRAGEVPLLVAAWVAPLAAPAIASGTNVSLTPVLLVLLVAAGFRRASATVAVPVAA